MKRDPLVTALRTAADEIEGCGGGNEANIMRAAAERITRLQKKNINPNLGWIVREIRNSSGELVDCFVEGPRAEDMPYGLEVLGDDYTGYGELEAKYEHCKLIASWANGGEEAICRVQ